MLDDGRNWTRDTDPMSAFDRDASIERHQIREISLNVARRLRQVLDRNQYIPAALRPEVDSSIRVITGIQRDIDQIMSALPTDEALDFAILTHIMGGQRHALDLLEILEEKLEGGRNVYQRDSSRVHQALLAVSREIERDAQRYAVEFSAPASATGRGSPSQQSRTAGKRPATTAPARQGKKPSKSPATLAVLRTLAIKPVPVALLAMAVGAGVVLAALRFVPSRDVPAEHQVAGQAEGEKLEGRLVPTAQDSGGAEGSAHPIVVAAPAMEQPYLVVLTTRRNTEELQQDYRSYKASYPDLLGNAKARVDRVQGQDKETWYRLSLIPPQARDDAKSLCSSLRKAGLTGCWIKPVPLR